MWRQAEVKTLFPAIVSALENSNGLTHEPNHGLVPLFRENPDSLCRLG